MHDRGGLERIDRRVPAAAHHEEGEEPDIRPDVEDRVAIPQLDSVPQVALVLEDFLVEIVRLVRVEMRDLQAVRQNPPSANREAALGFFLTQRLKDGTVLA